MEYYPEINRNELLIIQCNLDHTLENYTEHKKYTHKSTKTKQKPLPKATYSMVPLYNNILKITKYGGGWQISGR